MQYTENLELPLFETDDAVDLFTTYNAAMTTLDEAVEEKATSADVDAVEQIATAAGATATQAQSDATQALTDAATASTAAAGAATAATAAAALAQQAIDMGLKVKKLSSTEVADVLSLNTGTNGIRGNTGFYGSYDSYVINLTPRIKLVSASAMLTLRNSFALNTDYLVTSAANPPNSWGVIYSFVPEFDASVEITSSIVQSAGFEYHVKFNGSGTIDTNKRLIVTMVGFISYTYDIDLGTDIQ